LHKITDVDVHMLFDPWEYLGPKRRRMLERGWAGLFQRDLLKELPVERIAPCFLPSFGLPTKELHTMLGVMVLQQMLDLTDAEAVATPAEDVLLLVELFRNEEAVICMASYRMLKRSLSEQCEVKREGGEDLTADGLGFCGFALWNTAKLCVGVVLSGVTPFFSGGG